MKTILEDGTIEYRNAEGELHREDGPAIEYANGDKVWYLNDKRHREDGPAVEYVDGYKYWFLNDELHCEHGPAIEWPSGIKHWFINGVEYSKTDFNKLIEE